MAGLKQDKSGNFAVTFWYQGHQRTRSADTKDSEVAKTVKAGVEATLMRLKKGWLTIPEGVDAVDFIVNGGVVVQQPALVFEQPASLTLEGLFKLYDSDSNPRAKESTTNATEGYHKAHLLRVIGADTPLESISLDTIQRYVTIRPKELFQGKIAPKPPTIKKELATLSVIWHWALRLKKVAYPLPFTIRDLSFDRTEDKAPFQTYDDIARTIKLGGLTEDEQEVRWECLYLSLKEVHEVLGHVRETSLHPFIHPMVVFAAMTGARRSEICRSRIEDWDFRTMNVKIREKKRKAGRSSFRMVEINSFLAGVMRPWLDNHPGGQFTIAKDGEPLTVKMASYHFDRTLSKHEKWKKIPGFHTLRHSFASILASEGVDEPTIDLWMGHQTLEQRERYRHLFPKNLKRSIENLTPEGQVS